MIGNRCSSPSQAATGIKLQILFDRPCTFNGNPIKRDQRCGIHHAGKRNPTSLRFGPLSGRTVHLCIDMQNVFAEPNPWHSSWMAGVLPAIEEIVGYLAEQTVFTRFIPPASAEEVPGTRQRYFYRWEEMTLERIDGRLLELVPSLARSVPPAVGTVLEWFRGCKG